jgi:beta-glucanase (GH16 family)
MIRQGGSVWRAGVLAGAVLVVTSCGMIIKPAADTAPPHWKLTWSDEFNSPAALKKWSYDVGGNGWSLKQLQWYDRGNATVGEHGGLDITAAKEGKGHHCWYGPCRYTSVRMSTYGIFAQTYGIFEAKIKVPMARGLWPAFWLEGANVFKVGWPACGEIDITETNGHHPDLVQGFAHAPSHYQSGQFKLPQTLSAGYHVYGVKWTAQGISWFVDGHTYAHANAYPGWPFNHPFYIILDLAVGGNWPGSPGPATRFPAHMLVDWVRVYRQAQG